MTTNNNYFEGNVSCDGNLTGAFLYGDGSNITNIVATDVVGTANYMPYFNASG